MPQRAPHPCASPGCPALIVRDRYCPRHQSRRADNAPRRQSDRRYNAQRPDSDRFYGTATWRRFRDSYLRAHPLCSVCESQGRLAQAAIVDHVVALRERPDLALDERNMRSLCRRCHNQVGARVRKGEGGSKVQGFGASNGGCTRKFLPAKW